MSNQENNPLSQRQPRAFCSDNSAQEAKDKKYINALIERINKEALEIDLPEDVSRHNSGTSLATGKEPGFAAGGNLDEDDQSPLNSPEYTKTCSEKRKKRYNIEEDDKIFIVEDSPSSTSPKSDTYAKNRVELSKRKSGQRKSPEGSKDKTKKAKRRVPLHEETRKNSTEVSDLQEETAPNISEVREFPFKAPRSVALTNSEYKSMTAEALRYRTNTWIDEVDAARRKSKNIQGTLSGVMKDRLDSLKELINCLAEKASDGGDPIFYKIKIRDLQAELKIKKQAEKTWLADKMRKDKAISMFAERNKQLEDILWKKSRGKPHQVWRCPIAIPIRLICQSRNGLRWTLLLMIGLLRLKNLLPELVPPRFRGVLLIPARKVDPLGTMKIALVIRMIRTKGPFMNQIFRNRLE